MSRVINQIAIDARAGHVVDIERVWIDPASPPFHRFVCTCGVFGPDERVRRRAVARGNHHRRATRLEWRVP